MSYYAEWNQPNYQHKATPREFKTIRHADGTLDRQPYDEIDGYDDWGRIELPARGYVRPQKRSLDPNPRLRANRILRATPKKTLIRVR